MLVACTNNKECNEKDCGHLTPHNPIEENFSTPHKYLTRTASCRITGVCTMGFAVRCVPIKEY